MQQSNTHWKLLIIAILCISGQLFSQDTVNPIITKDTVQPVMQTAVVLLNNDTLFSIYSYLGPFSPGERAKIISEMLEELADEPEFFSDSMHVLNQDHFSLIQYGKKTLASVSDIDAFLTGIDREVLAESNLNKIEAAILQYRSDQLTQNWFFRILLAGLWLGGLILIIFLINRLFRWIYKKVSGYEKKLKRKRQNILRYIAPKGPEYFSAFLLRVGKILLILLFLFAYLPLIFTLFPVTQRIVYQFYEYIADPLKSIANGFYNFLPSLFFIVIIFLVARYIVRILSLISSEIENEKIKFTGFHKDWAKPTLNIFKIIIYVFALIFMFPYLPGSSSPAFQGVSIFFGVLLSLGSTSAIANIVAGVVITYMRPFMIGDRVKVGNTIGDVMEKTLLVTRIRTIKNVDVTIPNAAIINTHLFNYTKNAKFPGLILHTSVTIGYDVPWEDVNKLLLKAARKTKLLQRDPKPFVMQKILGDFSVEYEINVYTKQAGKMSMIYSDLHTNIQVAFNEAGVEILSPSYVAMRDGDTDSNEDDIPTAPKTPVEKVIDKVTGKPRK